MIKKLFTCLLTCSVIFLFTNCEDDDSVGAPGQTTLAVDATSGLVDATEFTFTINQVQAQNVTLYPYGLAQAKQGTVPVVFDGGSATVKFTYANVGVYEAVVVTNNHNDDGSSIKNEVSNSITITITNDVATISEFSLNYVTGTGSDEKTTASDSTDIDQGTGDITVWVPYSVNVTQLTPVFSASDFSTVTVGGTAQTSGEGKRDFTNPVEYTVTAHNGSDSKVYTVTVVQQAVETNADVKSVSGTLFSESQVAEGAGKSIPGYVGSDYLVLYALGVTGTADFDSVSVVFALDGKFSSTESSSGDSLNLATPKEMTVEAQDGTEKTYTIYGVEAPELSFILDDLIPEVEGEVDGFEVTFDVLSQTSDIVNVYLTEENVPAGVTIDGYAIKDVGAFTSGDAVDFSDGAVTLEVMITDANIGGETYTVSYTLSLDK